MGPSDEAARRLRWTTTEEEALTLPGLGRPERVRHPEFAGVEFLHVRAKSLLNHVPAASGLPFEWTINVYRGCSHACTFCFARPTHRYLELDPATEFATRIVVKVNAVERLRAELRRPGWSRPPVALGTNTDPYQRAEGRYRLTRGVLEALTTAGNPYSVLTRSPLVLRDLDLLREAERRTGVTVSFSVPTLDEDVWRLTEPGAPHPRARLEAVAALTEAGIPAGVMVAPIIPGLSDDRLGLEAVTRAAIEAGAVSVTPIVLHLRPGVREIFTSWLAEARPELLERYRRLYAGGANAERRERERLTGLVRTLVRRHGGPRVAGRRDARGRGDAATSATPPPHAPEQLALL